MKRQKDFRYHLFLKALAAGQEQEMFWVALPLPGPPFSEFFEQSICQRLYIIIIIRRIYSLKQINTFMNENNEDMRILLCTAMDS